MFSMVREIILSRKDESSYPGRLWQSFIAYSQTGKKLNTMMLVDEEDKEIFNTINTSISSKLNEDGTWEYPILSEMSQYLRSLVVELCTSSNEMWFVEYDDDELNELMLKEPNFLELLKEEVFRFGLNDVIEIENSEDCFITVYSNLMSAINYDDNLFQY